VPVVVGSGEGNAAGRRSAVVGFYKMRWGLGLVGKLGTLNLEWTVESGRRRFRVDGPVLSQLANDVPCQDENASGTRLVKENTRGGIYHHNGSRKTKW
jgi:hypothetical protein